MSKTYPDGHCFAFCRGTIIDVGGPWGMCSDCECPFYIGDVIPNASLKIVGVTDSNGDNFVSAFGIKHTMIKVVTTDSHLPGIEGNVMASTLYEVLKANNGSFPGTSSIAEVLL